MGENLNNVREESILYELLEYLVRRQEPELIKCKNDAAILPTTGTLKNALRYLNKRCTLPDSLIQYISLTLPWKFAVGDNGRILAILQENIIEIRRLKDEYSSVVAKVSVPKDAFPQWRKLAWSPDGTILVFSLSNGNISFYNSFGNNICSINSSPTCTDTNILEADDAVASMIFKNPNKKDNKWDYEFIYVTYKGALNSYYISSLNGYESNHSSITFMNFYKNGINGVSYCGKQNLYFVSGNNIYQSYNTVASEAGLTVWRTLNNFPYYKLCTSLEEEIPNKSRFSLWNYMPFINSKVQTVIFKMSINPSSELLACLHMDGTVSLWSIPNLKIKNEWKLTDQPDYNQINPISGAKVCKYPQGLSEFHPLDIGWWSDQALVIARYSGAISICSIKNLQNLLGSSPEFLFGPLQMVESSAIRGVLCLDCEIYVMSTKRNSANDDDTSSESDKDPGDNESGSILDYATTILQNILYSMTDIEKFQPKRRKSKIYQRTYRILGLKSTTPEELYVRKIEIEEYEEALNLANTYHLDKDLVYQTQWRKSEFSINAITDHLSKVSKRSWVLNECVSRVPDNLFAARELLTFGLQQSSLQMLITLGDNYNNDDVDFISLEHEDEINVTLRQAQQINQIIKKLDISKLNDAQKELIKYRRNLLKHTDMLKTYEVLLDSPENYDKEFYREFRQMSPVENAVKFAKDGNCKGVIIMFTYFESALISHWLPIICFFPETLNPENYKQLLPKCDKDNQLYLLDQIELRQKDWSERQEFQEIVSSGCENEDMSDLIYENNPWFIVYRNTTLTPEILCDWYKKRCYEIERLSGLVDNALSLINIGKSNNIAGLEKLLIELQTLDDLVYKVNLENQTLDDLDKLTDLEKVKLLMSRANEANFISHVNNTLIPFAKKKKVYEDAHDVNKLLHDYFVSLSKNNLFYILEFVRFTANSRNPELYDVVDDYISFALDCIYHCDSSNMLSDATNIYETIIEDYENEEIKTPVPRKAVETLREELHCLEILVKYDVKIPLKIIKDYKKNPDTIKTLFIQVCNAAKKIDPPATEETWSQLLFDLLDIGKLLLRSTWVNELDICVELCLEARLKSGVNSIIQNSKSLMVTVKNKEPTPFLKVPFEKSVDLVLEASHEYFNNAKSLVDLNMKLAKTCLHLIETDHKKIKVEFDLINSLQLLNDFHLNILPLQVKLMQDKLKLIENCLNSRSDAYKCQQKLLDVAKYLRIDNNARNREGKVLELIARKAYQVEDYNYCGTVIRRLIELNHQPAWQVASQLGHCDKYRDLKFRRQCLWFVVNVGPDDLLQETIKYINILETEILDVDLQNWMEMKEASFDCDDEFTDAISTPNIESKEFIPKIIESSSKLVKDSTLIVKQSMIDIVKNRDVWAGNIANFLKRSESITHNDNDNMDQSKSGVVQSFSSFYESLHEENKISNLDTKYNSFSIKNNQNDEYKLCQTLLRVEMLKESSCNGQNISDISELLIQCTKNTIMEDSLLAIGFLLSIKNDHVSKLKKMFDDLPQTKLLIQLAAYYCSLKLYRNFIPESDNIHLYDPLHLISAVAKLIESADSKDELTLLLKDRLQALVNLKREGRINGNEKSKDSGEKLIKKINVTDNENDGWDDQWSDADWGEFDSGEPKELKNIDPNDEIILIYDPSKPAEENTIIFEMSEDDRFQMFEEKYEKITSKEIYVELKTLIKSWPMFSDEEHSSVTKNPILKMMLKIKELVDKSSPRYEDEILEEFRDFLDCNLILKESLIEFMKQYEADLSFEEKLFLKLRASTDFHMEVVNSIKERKEDLTLPPVILEEVFFQNLTPHFSPNHHMYHKILEVVFLNRKIPEIQEYIEILIKKLVQQKNIPHAVALLSQIESVPPCLSTYDSCFQRLLKK